MAGEDGAEEEMVARRRGKDSIEWASEDAAWVAKLTHDAMTAECP